MSLLPPITVGKLQTALHTKAKNSPGYRFYALYDKLYRRDILEWAFVRCLQQSQVSRGSTARALRTSRRTDEERVAGRTDGRTQERRRIVPGRSDACTSRKGTAS